MNHRHLGARQLVFSGERLRKELFTAPERLRVQLEFPVARGRRRNDPGADQPQHPAQILRRDILPGAAKDVSANHAPIGDRGFDRSLGSPRRTKAQGPERREVILGLYRAEPRHDRRRTLERLAGNELAG